MKQRPFLLTALIVTFFVTSGRHSALALDPVYTSRTRFRIPFQLDDSEIQRLNAQEVRLFLSIDHGHSWQHVQSARPDAGRFEFQAPGDGEYWFDVKTLDASQRHYPDTRGYRPGLSVIVDSTPPVLELVATEPAPDRVQVDWKVHDANVEPSALTLEYRDGASAWQRIAIVPRLAGRTAWTMPIGVEMSVRGRVSDRCGNVGSDECHVQRYAGRALSNLPSASAIPAGHAGSVPALPPIGNLSPPLQPPVPGTATTDPDAHLPRYQGPQVNRGSAADANRFPGSAPGIHAQSPDQHVGPQTAGPSTEARGRVRLVKSTRFQLGYKLDDVGPSGVSGVELFVTEDAGVTWYRYGVDDDQSSPFHVEVPGEGTYGFTIRARSGAGLALRPPRPGQAPTVVVAVDLTPPQVLLNPVETRAEGQTGQALITWIAYDAHPASRPVYISYAPTGDGPWEPISGWQVDTGSFSWLLGAELPPRVYFRVTFRDAAGNLSYSVTPEPIVVDTSRPSARIVDVEPIETP